MGSPVFRVMLFRIIYQTINKTINDFYSQMIIMENRKARNQ